MQEAQLRQVLSGVRRSPCFRYCSRQRRGLYRSQGFHNVLETALLHYGGMRQARTTILRTASGNDLPMPTSNDTENEGVIISENPSEKVAEKELPLARKLEGSHVFV